MRLVFPNTTRPKKAAKYIAKSLNLSLSSIQNAIAQATGYQGWHQLEITPSVDSTFKLDEELSHEMFVDRQAQLVLSMSRILNVSDGDIQYALCQ